MSEFVEGNPKTIKIPGLDHPITIECNAHRIVIAVAGRVADTRAALTLREASYPPVQYVPRQTLVQRGLDLRGALCRGRRDQGPRRFLSRPCGHHRGTAGRLAASARAIQA
jgi:hypothetical protein